MLGQLDPAYARECFNKIRHYTEGAAIEHMQRLLRDPQCIDADRLRYYKCRFAVEPDGHWHVGHAKKGKE